MNVAVIGSGGREHALCESLKRSKKVDKIFCMPGNAGTGLIAENVDIRVDEFEKIKNFAIENEVNIVVVGPEKPLVDGIVEYLEKFNIKVFGPNKLASQLEGSKFLQKNFVKNKKFQLRNLEFS